MSNRRRASPDAPGGSMGDVLEDLRQEGHLTQRQYQACVLFLRDLQAYHGDSAGLVGQVSERVSMSNRPRVRPSGGPSISHLDSLLGGLRPHERELMAYLVKGREQLRGTLADFGRLHSGYQTMRTARAVAVGRIGALLDTLVDEYLGA